MNKPKYITPIIKLTEACNFSCEYCRYAYNDALTSIADYEDVLLYIEKVIEYNLSQGEEFIHVIFHGGEPLLYGKKNFRNLVDWQKSRGFKFINSIQTNGFLLDDEWCDIFNEGCFDVGISIDGPQTVNGHIMKERRVDNLILEKIKLLDNNNCRHGILSVITDKHQSAKDYYDFLVSNDIHSVGLCYCYQNCHNAVSNNVLSKFLCELFDLYFYGRYKLSIREFDCAIQRMLKGKTTSCHCNERNSCGKYLSILPNGDVRFCDSYDLSSSVYGNLKSNSVSDIVLSNLYQNEVLKSQIIKNEICNHCEVFDICGSGCYRNDIDNKSNYFCETYKSVYEHIRNQVSKYMENEK